MKDIIQCTLCELTTDANLLTGVNFRPSRKFVGLGDAEAFLCRDCIEFIINSRPFEKGRKPERASLNH